MKSRPILCKLFSLCVSVLMCIVLTTSTALADIELGTYIGEGLADSVISYEYFDDVNFRVTLPKNIPLNKEGFVNYPVKVEGAISPTRTVSVAPIDAVKSEEGINFMLKNTLVPTIPPVTASVIQPKTVWSSADVYTGVQTDDNVISSSAIVQGSWRGEIKFRINIDGSDEDPLDIVGNIIDGGTYPVGIVIDIPTVSSITLPNSAVVDGIKGSLTLTIAGSYSITLDDDTVINFTIVDDSVIPISSLVYGGTYDTGLKVAVEPDSTLIVDGEEVSTVDNIYTFDSEGEYELTYLVSGTLNVAKIRIKHSHLWKDGVCKKCSEVRADRSDSIKNLVDGETYAVGTTLEIDPGSEITVNGDIVSSPSSGVATLYTFINAGDYVVNDGAKEINISVSDSEASTIDSLVNGETYMAGTEIEIPETSTITIDGIPTLPVSNKITLGEGDFTLIQTDSDRNAKLAVIKTHEHDYTGTVLSDSTCVTEGESMYVCDCGSEYIDAIPTIAHNWIDGKPGESVICSMCGWEVGTEEELAKYYKNTDTYEGFEANGIDIDKSIYTDDKIVTLTEYRGSDTDVIVYGAYMVHGVPYITYIGSNFLKENDDGDGSYVDAYETELFYGNEDIISVTFKGGVKALDLCDTLSCCPNLERVDLSGLNTEHCLFMSYMFYASSSLSSVNATGLDTSNVLFTKSMFSECSSLTSLDFTSFDTSSMVGMESMFRDCSNLTTIYVSDKWKTEGVCTNLMFSGCGTDHVTYKS